MLNKFILKYFKIGNLLSSCNLPLPVILSYYIRVCIYTMKAFKSREHQYWHTWEHTDWTEENNRIRRNGDLQLLLDFLSSLQHRLVCQQVDYAARCILPGCSLQFPDHLVGILASGAVEKSGNYLHLKYLRWCCSHLTGKQYSEIINLIKCCPQKYLK